MDKCGDIWLQGLLVASVYAVVYVLLFSPDPVEPIFLQKRGR